MESAKRWTGILQDRPLGSPLPQRPEARPGRRSSESRLFLAPVGDPVALEPGNLLSVAKKESATLLAYVFDEQVNIARLLDVCACSRYQCPPPMLQMRALCWLLRREGIIATLHRFAFR